MMTNDEDTRITIQIPTASMDRLEEELPVFQTKSAIFQHLAQTYLDAVDAKRDPFHLFAYHARQERLEDEQEDEDETCEAADEECG